MHSSIAFNFQKYHQQIWGKPCLFCELAHHRSEHSEHYLYEDDFAIVVLDRYPTQCGYTLVAPKKHLEKLHEINGDVYLHLQRIVYLTIIAVQKALSAERVYTACLGSFLLTPHIHYHIVPLPSGLPFEKQQWEALNKAAGVIQYSQSEFEQIASKIRYEINVLIS